MINRLYILFSLIFLFFAYTLHIHKIDVTTKNNPTPAEYIKKKKDRQTYKKFRQEYHRKMHKAAPDTDWEKLNQDYRDSRSRKITESRVNNHFNQTQSYFDRELEGTWEERGSNNLAGRVHIVDVDFEEEKIYCGSSGGNIWLGSLEGDGWVSANDYMQLNNINMLRSIPINQNQNRLLVSAHNKFYYSDNEGFTLQESSGLEGVTSWGRIYKSVVSYYNQNEEIDPVIYILAKESTISSECSETSCGYWLNYGYTCNQLINNYGYNCSVCESDGSCVNPVVIRVFRSDDAGENFYPIYETLTSSDGSYDIWTDRYEPSSLFLLDNGSLYSISYDNEVSFIGVVGPFNQGENILAGGRDDENNGLFHFYAKIGSRLYVSHNSGEEWTDRGELPSYTFSRNSFNCSYKDKNLVTIGGIDLYKSHNAGFNWEKVNDWWEYYGDPAIYLHADIPGIQFLIDNNNNEIAYVSTDGGLYYSGDGLNSVQNLSLDGLGVSQYYSTFTKRDEPFQIFAGSQDQGFQRSIDYSNSIYDFEQVISGDYGHLVSSDYGHSIWTVYPGFAMYYPNASENSSGVTWNFEMSGALWLPPLMEDPEHSSSVYLAGGGLSGGHHIIKLTRSGNNIQIDEGEYSFDNTITAMAYSPIDNAYRYALTYSGSFYYSFDGGINWTMSEEFSGPGSHYFYGAKILPSKVDLGKVIIAGSGYSNPPVFITNNHGVSFDGMSNGMPSTLVYDLASTDEDAFIFAATAVGAFVFSTEEQIWEDITEGLAPDQTYWTLEYVSDINSARFGTYGRGIWDFIINENYNILYGDLNQDEIINIQDIIVLINITLSNIVPTEYQTISGDINQDGTIDILDIINCINIILNN